MRFVTKRGSISDSAQHGAEREVREHCLQHLDALYTFARWLVQDAEEAQDLVQETYAKALRSGDQFRIGTNLKAWLFQILKHLFLNRRRQVGRGRAYTQDTRGQVMPSRLGAAETGHTIASDLRLDVNRAIQQLPEEFQLAILLSDVEEFSHEEIAAILGCPVGTVKSRLSRGRALLRRALTAYTENRAREQVHELS
jgi:RNA polymerase sigma-70 factor, ECF subfamily